MLSPTHNVPCRAYRSDPGLHPSEEEGSSSLSFSTPPLPRTTTGGESDVPSAAVSFANTAIVHSEMGTYDDAGEEGASMYGASRNVSALMSPRVTIGPSEGGEDAVNDELSGGGHDGVEGDGGEAAAQEVSCMQCAVVTARNSRTHCEGHDGVEGDGGEAPAQELG